MVANIGIIGMGNMGTKFAKEWANQGYDVYCFDNDPEAEKRSKVELADKYRNIQILQTGPDVLKVCHATGFYTPIAEMNRSIQELIKYARLNSIVFSGSSVQTIAEPSFNTAPNYVDCLFAHSLYGPTVNPRNQNTVIVPHKASDTSIEFVKQLFGSLKNKTPELESAKEHDKIMSHYQGTTHMASMSYGLGVMIAGLDFWKDDTFKDNLQRIQTDMMIRTFAGNVDVYRDISMMNPFAEKVARVYKEELNNLYNMELNKEDKKLKNALMEVKDFVFENVKDRIHLDDPRMGEYRLGSETAKDSRLSTHIEGRVFLVTAAKLYENPACQTGPYRLRLGRVEHVYTNKEVFESSLETLKSRKELNYDMAFVQAGNMVSDVIINKNKKVFNEIFKTCRNYYLPKIEQAMKESDEMIEKVSSFTYLDRLV